jgi:hypothetical protein
VVLTVRNGTAQTFGAGSGFSVQVSGGLSVQPFPRGTAQWKPGSVLVFYTLAQSPSVFPPNFTFNFKGSVAEKPTSIFYNVQYNPSTFAQFLNNLVATRLVGGRYRLV